MTKVKGWMKVAAGISLVCVFAAGAAGEDWPKWRGPDGNGISKEKLDPADQAKTVWKTEVGEGYSAVSITGDRLYTMGNRNDEDQVVCLSVKDGGVIWKYSYPCKKGGYPGPRATPSVDGKDLYTFSREGLVLCLDAEKGTKKWEKNVAAEFKLPGVTWGFSSSVLIDGDAAVVNAGKFGVALSRKDGSRIWVSPAEKSGYAVPVSCMVGGRKCFAVFGQKAVFGVDAGSGTELWSYPWETSYDINAADPVYSDGKLFISSGYKKSCAMLDISGGNAKQIWTTTALNAQFSSVVLLDGFLYGVDGNANSQGSLVCLSWENGAEKWRSKLGHGSFIIVGGKIVFLNEKGTLFVAEAASTGYKQLSKTEGLLPKTCWTPPAYSRGKLFCRDAAGNLGCFEIGK